MKTYSAQIGKTDRQCYPFPWVSKQTPQPWSPKHVRVIIPLSVEELKSAKPNTKCHIMILRQEKVCVVNGGL